MLQRLHVVQQLSRHLRRAAWEQEGCSCPNPNPNRTRGLQLLGGAGKWRDGACLSVFDTATRTQGCSLSLLLYTYICACARVVCTCACVCAYVPLSCHEAAHPVFTNRNLQEPERCRASERLLPQTQKRVFVVLSYESLN